MINKNEAIQTPQGLTKREYFAAMAMQGLLSADVEGKYSIKDAVVVAIKHADALIKELEKPNGKS